MKKTVLQKPLSKIPVWMILLALLSFFPFGIFLLVLRRKRKLDLAAKSLIGVGIFWSVGIVLLMFTTVTQGSTSVSDFLIKLVLLLALSGCHVSCGLRLLQGPKEQLNVSEQQLLQQSHPVVCPCCGACNVTSRPNQECEYCGMLLPQEMNALDK